jgi:hypothetical protein
MQKPTWPLHLAVAERTAPQTNQTTHVAQVKKVGDFTEDRVRGLVSALDRLDSKVKANRSGDKRDELEQVRRTCVLSLPTDLVQCECRHPGSTEAEKIAAHTCPSRDERAGPHDSLLA